MSNISVVHQKNAKFNMFVESNSSKTRSKMTICLLLQLRCLYVTFSCLSREQDFYVGTSTGSILHVFHVYHNISGFGVAGALSLAYNCARQVF